MVGDMENLKVKANNNSERNEIQKLFITLGYNFVNNIACEKGYIVASQSSSGINFDYWADVKEITLKYLRTLVVLKRNSIEDATHYYGDNKYYLTDSEFYQYSEDKWVNIDEYVDGMTFKKIGKELKVKNKEYLVENMYGEYKLTDHHSGFDIERLIEVPEGAEEYRENHRFYKNNGKLFYAPYEEWVESGLTNYKTLWQRNPTTPNTLIQDKLKFIEKWLNGEKIQYILGIESNKTQADKSKWHNFTEGAMQYIKRSDIKFREAPKYVTINGIEFKSVEKLVKYVNNNFDLEDGE